MNFVLIFLYNNLKPQWTSYTHWLVTQNVCLLHSIKLSVKEYNFPSWSHWPTQLPLFPGGDPQGLPGKSHLLPLEESVWPLQSVVASYSSSLQRSQFHTELTQLWWRKSIKELHTGQHWNLEAEHLSGQPKVLGLIPRLKTSLHC